MYYRQTYACWTVRQNRKGLPATVKKAELKPLESVFLRNGPMLCLKWSGPKKKSKKKPVTILSTIHSANELLTPKTDPHGNHIPKPVAIHEYTKNMSGVDILDQYMSFHVSLWKKHEMVQEIILPLIEQKVWEEKDEQRLLHRTSC